MSVYRTQFRILRAVALLVVCGLSSIPCSSLLAAPAVPPFTEDSGPNGPFFSEPGDLFQGGLDSPEIIVPAAPPVIAPAAPPLNVNGRVPQFQPVQGMWQGGTNGVIGGVNRAIQNSVPIVGAVAPVSNVLGQVRNGNAGAALGTFVPRQPGNALGEVAGVLGAVGAIGNAAGQGLENFGQGRPSSLQGILGGLGGGAAAGALGNRAGAGPFGQFIDANNQTLQGMQLIALIQQLFGSFFPVDSALQFNESNTGESARTAYVNLMGAGQSPQPVSDLPAAGTEIIQIGTGLMNGVRGDFSNISAADLEGCLPDNLKPYAQDFVDAGRQYQLDPRFLASISRVETGDGTSRAFRTGNNAMGISTPSGPVYDFGSVRESIMRQSSTLANPKGPYSNANTIQEIGGIYAPVGASNDFNGTNGGWASEVGGFYEKMQAGMC